MRNGSFTVKEFRLYDENSSSKRRSPAAHIAAHIAQTWRTLQLLFIFAEKNDSTPGY